jgi:ribonuclease HI
MALEIHIDGAARGNPGPAAAGVVIHDHQGRQILEAGYHLQPMTNNQAEYHALLLALQAADKWGERQITVHSDSELLVRQLTGRYRLRSEGLRPLFEQAQKLLLRFDNWQLNHIPREANTRADQLANKALDARADVIDVQLGDVAPAHPSAQTAGSPIVIVAKCTRAPADNACPADCQAGQRFRFADVLPAGLCLHAAQSMINAVMALRHSAEQGETDIPTLTVRCSRRECQAVFELSPE